MTREKWLDPSNWASLKPFGIGEEHPNNYLELWKAFKENRDQARYAWRILAQGTCVIHPGFPGGSIAWKAGWSHGTQQEQPPLAEAVPA